MATRTGPLFGGDSWPIGFQVGFVERTFDDVLEAMTSWLGRGHDGPRQAQLPRQPLLAHLLRMAPLQMPPGRDVVVETTGGWTMHADNSRLGGDSWSWAGHLSDVLGCRGVVACHVPIDKYSYPATKFELFGPTGKPPLNYIRTISAGIFDEDRWRFDVSGDPLPFEELTAYRAPRIRDRFGRDLLVRYLQALGIRPDDPEFFGRAVLFEARSDPRRWELDLAQVREQYLGLRSWR